MYPDVFVPLGLIKPDNPIYRVMSWVNGKLYASADHVVALGRDMARLVEDKAKGRAQVSVIPNWGDVDVIEPTLGWRMHCFKSSIWWINSWSIIPAIMGARMIC